MDQGVGALTGLQGGRGDDVGVVAVEQFEAHHGLVHQGCVGGEHRDELGVVVERDAVVPALWRGMVSCAGHAVVSTVVSHVHTD